MHLPWPALLTLCPSPMLPKPAIRTLSPHPSYLSHRAGGGGCSLPPHLRPQAGGAMSSSTIAPTLPTRLGPQGRPTAGQTPMYRTRRQRLTTLGMPCAHIVGGAGAAAPRPPSVPPSVFSSDDPVTASGFASFPSQGSLPVRAAAPVPLAFISAQSSLQRHCTNNTQASRSSLMPACFHWPGTHTCYPHLRLSMHNRPQFAPFSPLFRPRLPPLPPSLSFPHQPMLHHCFV